MSSAAFPDSITQLLNAWSHGQDHSMDRLVPLVYADLKRMARRHMKGERDDHVLQSTALVHEAFLRMGEQRGVKWSSRSQFFHWMSTLMRRILVDQARSRDTAKRGSGAVVDSLDALMDAAGGETIACPAGDEWLGLLQLDQALLRLEELDARQSRVVELRFFGGLTVEQTAEALEVSPATVKREWATARAWLLHELRN